MGGSVPVTTVGVFTGMGTPQDLPIGKRIKTGWLEGDPRVQSQQTETASVPRERHNGHIKGLTENFLRLMKSDGGDLGQPGSPFTPARLGMLLFWTWLLALGLLAGRGEAQSCTQEYGGPNLARGQPTSQSSTHPSSGASSAAVDGNCNGLKPALTCTHTQLQNKPWWSVDLGREYSVSLVVVKNREDGYGARIRGATVYVGSLMGDFSTNSIKCGTITDLREGSLTTIHCNGAVGRYITVAIPNSESYLTLCEDQHQVTHQPGQPFGMLLFWTWMLALGLLAGRGEAHSCTEQYGGPNLARGRPTLQSSTYAETGEIQGISSNAVDGNCDGRWTSQSCTHTSQELSPWWSVDLGKEYDISLVVVKNRQDCCGGRLQGATIHVGDYLGDFSESSFTCGTITDLRDGSLSTVLCNAAPGRYVTIVIEGRQEFLSLAEVEVHGTR
ncbi:UNVERIFIED_CONTAM: hypothetical protein K2H54_002307 [Gekko kuhli]